MFVIDLRQAAQEGSVAEWLGKPHLSRSIGAVYSESSPLNFMGRETARENYDYIVSLDSSYDALRFVETTTAARKNPGR